ncbi:MAG: hypothetical protein KAG61_02760 [Bacteriovoracaceae bacterium]|nr:hypothetical protein [Bacteriovoracaceae bacterium]
MKTLMISLFFALATNTSVFASGEYTFQSFKVNDVLNKRIDLMSDRVMERNDEEGVSRGLKAELTGSDIELNNALESKVELIRSMNTFGSTIKKSSRSINTRALTLPGQVDTSEYDELIEQGLNPVFAKIIKIMGPIYKGVGKTQAQGIILKNEQFNLGSVNHSGFTWQKPMGNFAIYVNRQLAPDLFDDTNWVVTDTLTIHVDATTFLTNMKQNGLISITTNQLSAFAGIQFKREYRYSHFADSFEDGLQKDYTNLFLSFTNFFGLNFLKMNQYEFMSKKDYLSFNAGIGAHIPITTGASIGAGVLVGYNRLSSVEVQKVGPKDSPRQGENYRVSFEKEKGGELEVSAKLQADFFNLLRLTLFSYEYTYSLSESDKIYLSIFDRHMDDLVMGSPEQKQLSSIFRMNRPDLDIIQDMVISSEYRKKQNKNSHFAIFLFGKLKKGRIEQVTIQKDGIEKTFFKSRYESIKYVKGLLTTLINGLTTFFTNTELFKSYKASRSRDLMLEYEDERQLTSKDKVQLREEKLSINIEHEFTARKTEGWFNKKYKRYAEHFTRNFTNLPSKIANEIKNKNLVGPLKIRTTAWINKDGLKRFNKMNNNSIVIQLAKICKYERPKKMKWWKRIRYTFKKGVIKGEYCYKKLTKNYTKYKNELSVSGDMSLWKLRALLIQVNKFSDNKDDLRRLFGHSNVFYNGSVEAYTKNDIKFKSYFKDGAIKSVGVIDDFQRESEAVRAPASIEVQ